MKKLIALLLSFAIAFTLGIPAFAVEESVQNETELPAEEVFSVSTDEVAAPFVEVEESAVDEPVKIGLESEKATGRVQSVIPETGGEFTENKADNGTDIPAIGDIIDIEEICDALEDEGIDVDELEESIESGETEIIEITDEISLEDLNFFELYGASVLTVMMEGADSLTSGLLLFALAPASLLLWAFPPVGAAYTIAGIPLGIILTLGGAVLLVISPVAGIVISAVIKSE